MRGVPWCGRPARYARRRATLGSPPFTYLHCPTNIEKTLGIPPSRTLCTAQHGIWLTPCVDTMTPTLQNPRPTQFNAPRPTSTSFACKSEPGVDSYVVLMPFSPPPLPRMQDPAGGSFYGVSMPLVSPPPLLFATVSRSWILRYFDALRVTTTSLACNSEPEVVFV
jgi:hypothetical protein